MRRDRTCTKSRGVGRPAAPCPGHPGSEAAVSPGGSGFPSCHLSNMAGILAGMSRKVSRSCVQDCALSFSSRMMGTQPKCRWHPALTPSSFWGGDRPKGAGFGHNSHPQSPGWSREEGDRAQPRCCEVVVTVQQMGAGVTKGRDFCLVRHSHALFLGALGSPLSFQRALSAQGAGRF